MSDVDVKVEVEVGKAVQRTVTGMISTLQDAINEQSIYFDRFSDALNNIKYKDRPFSDSNTDFVFSYQRLLIASGIIAELREIIEINNEVHQQFLGEVDERLQTLSTGALSLLADIIDAQPLEAIILGYGKIFGISSCLIGNCPNQGDPELQEAIKALDSALLSVDTRALNIEKIIAYQETFRGSDIAVAFGSASDEAGFRKMGKFPRVWVMSRNLGEQPTPAAKGPDPALGGQ